MHAVLKKLPRDQSHFTINFSRQITGGKEFFRTCNVLPFSCTHLALGKVKDPRYMQNKKDSRISLTGGGFHY
jgi:hypothetical protein